MDILKISFNILDYSLLVSANIIVVLVSLILLFAVLVVNRIFFTKSSEFLENVEYTVGPRQCQVKLKPNNEDIQVAFKLYVELSTRKIGLPIDKDHDLIIEVYNSWYEFFKLTRELIKELPISKVRACDHTNNIIDASIDVLNLCLRPHLTKWQAKFRHWYEKEINSPDNIKLTPQQIQSLYPEFKELIEELKTVNADLIEYRKQLRELAYGKRT